MGKKKNSTGGKMKPRIRVSRAKKINESGPINLIMHTSSRRGIRKHFCNSCSFATYSPSVLEEHKYSHTGQRPFQCDRCPKSFSRRSALWNHRRLHSDQRPFLCHLCPKTFKWKNSLMCHLRVHAKKENMQSRNVDEINRSIDRLKSNKMATYAGVLRQDKNIPIFKYGQKSMLENSQTDPTIDLSMISESETKDIFGRMISPVPQQEYGPRDFLVFDSAEDQMKFEQIFEDESENDIKPTILHFQPKVEENFDMDVSYEVIACGFESLSAEEATELKADMQGVQILPAQPGFVGEPIFNEEPGPSGIRLIVAAAAAIGFEDGYDESLPNTMAFDAPTVRELPVTMW